MLPFPEILDQKKPSLSRVRPRVAWPCALPGRQLVLQLVVGWMSSFTMPQSLLEKEYLIYSFVGFEGNLSLLDIFVASKSWDFRKWRHGGGKGFFSLNILSSAEVEAKAQRLNLLLADPAISGWPKEKTCPLSGFKLHALTTDGGLAIWNNERPLVQIVPCPKRIVPAKLSSILVQFYVKPQRISVLCPGLVWADEPQSKT